MKFDDLLVGTIGEFGRSQQVTYLLTCLLAVWSSMIIYYWTFIGGDVPHRCRLSSNDTEFNHTANDNKHTWNYRTPNDDYHPSTTQKCKMVHIKTEILHECKHGIIWDETMIGTSALQDWQLVCERQWLQAITQSLFYVGTAFGSMFMGSFANRYGRRPTIVVGATLMAVISSMAVFAPNIYIFIMIRFCQGFLCCALWQIPFVLGVEITGPSKRTLTGMIIELFFTAGIIILGTLAYFIRDWRHLQFTVALPGFLFISYFWVLPESPRWLLSMGRKEEADKILLAMAKRNGSIITDEQLNALGCDEEVKEKQSSTDSTPRKWMKSLINRDPDSYGYTDLFRNRGMRRLTILSAICWITVTLIYYAISLNPGKIGGDVYVSFIMSGVAEVPAILLLIFTLNILGRRFLQSVGFASSGLALVFILFIGDKDSVLTSLLVWVSKWGVTTAFCVIYLQTSECFPTVLRTIAMGFCVTISRAGGILSPFANMFFGGAQSHRSAVIISFSVLAILAASCTLLLPETTDKTLPETLEDGEKFAREIDCYLIPPKKKVKEETSEKLNTLSV